MWSIFDTISVFEAPLVWQATASLESSSLFQYSEGHIARREKHILLNLMAARRVFDFLSFMTFLEVFLKDTIIFKVSF